MMLDLVPRPALLGSAALAAAGFGLLQTRPVAVAVQTFVSALAVLVWAVVWHALLFFALSQWIEDWAERLSTITQVNMALATLSWSVPLTLTFFFRRRLPPCPKTVGAFATLVFAAAILLPQMGQDEAWPMSSVLLAVWCGVLALGLGAVAVNPARNRRIGAYRKDHG
jgi:hypothetical protein